MGKGKKKKPAAQRAEARESKSHENSDLSGEIKESLVPTPSQESSDLGDGNEESSSFVPSHPDHPVAAPAALPREGTNPTTFVRIEKPVTPPPAMQSPENVRRSLYAAVAGHPISPSDPPSPDTAPSDEDEATNERAGQDTTVKMSQTGEAVMGQLRQQGNPDEDTKKKQEIESKIMQSSRDTVIGQVEKGDATQQEGMRKVVEEAQGELEDSRRQAEALQQMAEEAMRRNTYEIAAAIAAEEEQRREQEEREQSKAESEREAERRREERERLDAHLTAQRSKQLALREQEERDAEEQRKDDERRAAEAARRQEEVRARAEERKRQDEKRLAEQRRRELAEQQRKELEEQRRKDERLRLEAEEALRELEQQGSIAVRKDKESTDSTGDPTCYVSASPSVGAPASPQQVEALLEWVNSVLPEDLVIARLEGLLAPALTLAVFVERLAGQLIAGLVRTPCSLEQEQHNLALALALLRDLGANRFGVQAQGLSLGGTMALCDLLWDMAECFVMKPQFLPLAEEADMLAYAEQGWMEGARFWVQQMTKVSVPDFAASFEDGRLLLAIVVGAWPGSQIDLAVTVQENSAEEVAELALSIAHRRWRVPRLLSTALVSQGAEPACVLLYLALMAQRLPMPVRTGQRVGMEALSARDVGPEVGDGTGGAGEEAEVQMGPPGVLTEDGVEGDREREAELRRGGMSVDQVEVQMLGRDAPGARDVEDSKMAQGRGDGGGFVAGGSGVVAGGSGSSAVSPMLRAAASRAPDIAHAEGSSASETRARAHTGEQSLAPAAQGAVNGGRAVGPSNVRTPTCAGCHTVLQRPRLLRCLHIFCLRCLEGMLEAHGNRKQVRCPACMLVTPVGANGEPDSLGHMNSDEGVLKVISLLSANAASGRGAQAALARPSLCDNCLQGSATVWCDVCDAGLCAECSVEVHSFRSINAVKKHNPRRLLPGERVPSRLPTCQVHPGEKMIFLSISKQQLICRECVLAGGHDRDRYVPVEDAGRQTRMDLADIIEQLESVQEQVDRAGQEAAMRTPAVLDAARARTHRLASRTEELKKAVHERKVAALEEASAERDRKAQRLLVQGVGIGRVAVALEHGALLGQLLMRRGNDLEVLRASQSLERLLLTASAIAVDDTPVEDPELFSGAVSTLTLDAAGAQGAPPAPPSSRSGDGERARPDVPTYEGAQAHGNARAPAEAGAVQQRATRATFESSALAAPASAIAARPGGGGSQEGGRAGGGRVGNGHEHGYGGAARLGKTQSNGESAQLLALAEPILGPKSAALGGGRDSARSGVWSVGALGARRDSSNGSVQQFGMGRVVGEGEKPNALWWPHKPGAAPTLYVLGGFDGTVNLSSMEAFDASAGAWRPAPPMACSRRGLAAAASEGRIYAVGGWDGRKYLDTMSIFDVFTGRWSEGPAMLVKRCFAAATFVGPHLYVVGGYYGATNLKSAERFDPASNEWLTLPNMSSARRGLGVAGFKSRLLLAVGGWDGKVNLSSVECLDVEAPYAWSKMAPLRVPRCSLACASAGDAIYVCGGWDGNDYLASAECLFPDGPTNEWQPITRMNSPRSYCAASISVSADRSGGSSSHLIVVGGWDGVGTRRLASGESLALPSQSGGGSGHADGAFVGAWCDFPSMLEARYGAALVAA